MRRGFTLIELLVVISIIAILAALLLPAIALVKKQALATSCRSTQRQMAMSMLTYSQEQEGYLVCNGTTAGEWWQALLPYAGTDATGTSQNLVPWRCPEWYRSGRWRMGTDGLASIGYGYNQRPQQPTSFFYHNLPANLTLGPYSSSQEFTLSMITHHSNRPMAGDSVRGVIVDQNGTNFFRSGTTYWTGDPTRHSQPELQASVPLTSSRANYIFYDGHVEALSEAPACAKLKDPATAP
jgi:prepilin-type N-terminal cleavage/methylation domain-containing protein/prepilin-type processing-associated H-X9-DG protein